MNKKAIKRIATYIIKHITRADCPDIEYTEGQKEWRQSLALDAKWSGRFGRQARIVIKDDQGGDRTMRLPILRTELDGRNQWASHKIDLIDNSSTCPHHQRFQILTMPDFADMTPAGLIEFVASRLSQLGADWATSVEIRTQDYRELAVWEHGRRRFKWEQRDREPIKLDTEWCEHLTGGPIELQSMQVSAAEQPSSELVSAVNGEHVDWSGVRSALPPLRLWLLRPVDPNAAPWQSWQDNVHGFVVRARCEDEARSTAQVEAGDEGVGEWSDEGTWLNPELTSCKPLEGNGDIGVIMRDMRQAK